MIRITDSLSCSGLKLIEVEDYIVEQMSGPLEPSDDTPWGG